MDIRQSKPSRRTAMAATLAMTFVVAAWILPPHAGLGREDAVASDGGEGGALSVFVNIPANEIQDGQFCQGYANVYNGTSPYTFEWSGQFTNSDIDCGFCPQGYGQVVNGNISSSRPDWLKVIVVDAAADTAEHTASLNIGEDFNEDCEAE